MMTRNERMLRRAELDAMARGRFDEMFPGCLDALDALTDMVDRSTRTKPDQRLLFSAGGRHYRPQAEYDRALRKLSGNVTIDPDVQEENIASVADHNFRPMRRTA